MRSTRSQGVTRCAGAFGALFSCALFSGAVWVGCGDSGDSDDDSSAGGSAGTSANNGGSGNNQALPTRLVASIITPAPGECLSTAMCIGGVGTPACATVGGGYRVCTFQPAVATGDSMYPMLDECNATKACAAGSSCFPVSAFADGICGAVQPFVRNACRKDGCASDADCSGGICGPRGFTVDDDLVGGAIRECIKASCKSNADCTAQANGMCALVQATCDPVSGTFLPAELACVYPNGCTATGNCPSDSICRVLNGVGVCARR